MLYCFIDEDLSRLPNDDELCIQQYYAQSINKSLKLSLNDDTLQGDDADSALNGETVMLRATCEFADQAIERLDSLHIDLLETKANIARIEDWVALGIARRPVFDLEVDCRNPAKLKRLLMSNGLEKCEKLFLKTKQKGISLDFCRSLLLEEPESITAFLEVMGYEPNVEMIAAPFMDIATDKYGPREVRFFVFNGNVANGSRRVHSMPHEIEERFFSYADEVAAKISQRGDFPTNYVLDIAEFGLDSTLDVVELNPITTSLCYANNSIFAHEPRINSIENHGIEFAFDALKHPDEYDSKLNSQAAYIYTSESHYSL